MMYEVSVIYNNGAHSDHYPAKDWEDAKYLALCLVEDLMDKHYMMSRGVPAFGYDMVWSGCRIYSNLSPESVIVTIGK